jgi:integrase
MKIKFRIQAISKLPIPREPTFYWDTELKGLGLKAYVSGKKTFFFQTRLNGRSRRFTIGPCGQWSPEQARQRALEMLLDTSKGIDPVAEKKPDATMTLRSLAERYERDAMGHKKKSTREIETGMIKRHILPLLGKRVVSELTKTDLQRFLHQIADGKTAKVEKTRARGLAIVKGGKGAANRVMDLLASMLTYSIDLGVRADNPAKGVKKYKLKRHDRYLSESELAALGAALKHAEENGTSRFAVAAIRFLLLSGCRRGEALSLEWAWLDFDHNIAKLPDSKTGQKVMLLGTGAIDLVKSLPRVVGSPLVFPSAAGGKTPISIQKAWDKIRKKAGLDNLRLHDLRHHFASAAVSSGQSLYIVGKLLGHSQSQTTQRYAHLAPDPVRQAADTISEALGSKLISDNRSGHLKSSECE